MGNKHTCWWWCCCCCDAAALPTRNWASPRMHSTDSVACMFHRGQNLNPEFLSFLSSCSQSTPTSRLLVPCRWHNHLNPEIKHGEWSREEDETIIKFHRKYGNQVSAFFLLSCHAGCAWRIWHHSVPPPTPSPVPAGHRPEEEPPIHPVCSGRAWPSTSRGAPTTPSRTTGTPRCAARWSRASLTTWPSFPAATLSGVGEGGERQAGGDPALVQASPWPPHHCCCPRTLGATQPPPPPCLAAEYPSRERNASVEAGLAQATSPRQLRRRSGRPGKRPSLASEDEGEEEEEEELEQQYLMDDSPTLLKDYALAQAPADGATRRSRRVAIRAAAGVSPTRGACPTCTVCLCFCCLRSGPGAVLPSLTVCVHRFPVARSAH